MNNSVQESLQLLGKRVKEVVTGIEGVVTSVSFDLYGCNSALVHPGIDKEGKIREMNWFDINRLTILDQTPVMPQPDFVRSLSIKEKGPELKPIPSCQP